MTEPLLRVEDLRTEFDGARGQVRAVDGVSFDLADGETLCIVGESGCGKSATALSIMRLLPERTGRIVAGRVLLRGHGDLAALPEEAMLGVRGNAVSMIFQEPMTSLNPVFTVGYQIAEAIRQHQAMERREAAVQAVAMLGLVGLPSPEQRARSYPHQLSGGMRQRVMIAMALACRPKLMLADEPTTALDVTVQAQILDLINRLKSEAGTAVVLITHNMGVVAEMAQRVAVMYAGVVVEEAPVAALFATPLHPYTQGLLGSIPRARGRARRRERLVAIPGTVPGLHALGSGCRFVGRCAEAHDRCRAAEPPLAAPGHDPARAHRVRCWLHLPAPAS
ncbi:MAG: ABC transporter ATP-binding protein [Alphaproteobacteria bacterium]|nr:ABC transporter ATP-binding protein [Alphaproteobacteria bacterium]